MAITSYSTLKTAIGDWLHRSDLTAQIPDFIALAESRLNRLLNLAKMEMDATLTMTIGSRFVTYPSDMSSPIALWLETYKPRQRINYATPTELPVFSTVSAYPQYFTIDGSNLAFDVLADQAHVLTFRYNKKLNLSDSAPTNVILDEYPDLYLFGALLESAPYIRDIALISMWQERFDRAVNEVSNNESKSRDLSTLFTEIRGRGSRFNINRGY